MIKNKVMIASAIRQAEDFFLTGDINFSIVEILQMVLPDGSTVDRPTIGQQEAQDGEDDGEAGEKLSRFKILPEVDGQWTCLGFTVTLPCLMGMGEESEADRWWRMEWVSETLRRVLDLHGRYKSSEYGPEAQDALGVPSLSYEYEQIGPYSFTLAIFHDDSTR